MKIAVCFSGGTRNFKDTYPFFKKNFQDIYNPDIFIYGVENKDGADNNLAEILELYTPIQAVINTEEFYKNDNFLIPEINFYTPTVIPMMYNIMECNRLKKQYEIQNNFTYDIVVRTRLDSFFTRIIQKSELETVINNNNILIPQNWSGVKGVHFLAECDGFAIGSSKAIDAYSNVFSKIRQINNGHPETILGIHLKMCGLSIQDIPLPVAFAYPNEVDIGNVEGHQRHMWRVKWDKSSHYYKFPN